MQHAVGSPDLQGGRSHTAQQWEELPVPEEALLLCTECCFLKASRDIFLRDRGLPQQGCGAGQGTEASLGDAAWPVR